jgi:hypothetical protein
LVFYNKLYKLQPQSSNFELKGSTLRFGEYNL